ncbi:MAG TPA: hypothetical protein PKD34_01105 [Candidatus Doudnabacteria bacterium]|nr:hypothetical protein [Candidatus Doudnabacteria bacterium]
MKHLFIILIIIIVAVGLFWLYRYINSEAETMTNDLISINTLCNGKKECVYDGKELTINVVITNIHSELIEIPIKYLQQKGPSITLINEGTEQELNLPTNLADPTLLSDRITIQPNGTTRISWIIHDEEVRSVGGGTVDITAKVTITSPIYRGGVISEVTSESDFKITH